MDRQDWQVIRDDQEKHEFHFVIARSMREKLKDLRVFKKLFSFSGIVEKILAVLRPVIKTEHIWGVQRLSQYRYVSPDPEEKRDHVHAYIDEDVYRELKLIHQDLNFYSIGQILRGFLELFLELVEEHGDDVFKFLDEMYKRWEDLADNSHLTLNDHLRHLRLVLPRIKRGNGHLALYDDSFTPLMILRL